MTNRPNKPIGTYPAAELPPLPPGAPGPVAADVARPRAEAARLRFLDPAALSSTVDLRHPFELDGREVRAIVVTRLSVAEAGIVLERYGEDDLLDIYDFASAMTGLAAPVLRGLTDDDGEELLKRVRPLLPRFARTAIFGADEANATAGATAGDGSPSPRPAD